MSFSIAAQNSDTPEDEAAIRKASRDAAARLERLRSRSVLWQVTGNPMR